MKRKSVVSECGHGLDCECMKPQQAYLRGRAKKVKDSLDKEFGPSPPTTLPSSDWNT